MGLENHEPRVLRCAGCSVPLGDEPFAGLPLLTDLLEIAFCEECRPRGPHDIGRALLNSGLLSSDGEATVSGFLRRIAPADVRCLYDLLEGEPDALGRYSEGREN